MAPRATAVLVAVAVNIGLGVIGVAAQAPAYSQPVVTGHHGRPHPHPGPPHHPGNGGGHGHGNGKPGSKKPAGPPPPPPDTTPPATPTISGTTVAPHGKVTLAFSAEGGSFLSVHQNGSYVAGTTASGFTQSLTWTAKGGRQIYTVAATDGSGNTSSSASVRVFVDVTPPPLGPVKVTAGDSEDATSDVSFTTDPGSRYRFLVDGKPAGPTASAAGAVARARHVHDFVDVPNGHHRVTVQVLDAVGNVRARSAIVDVDVTDLAVSTDVTSEPGRTRQVIKVTATPNATTATLVVPGHKPVRFPMRDGIGSAVLKLPNGSYDNAHVSVRDTQGRTGSSDTFTLMIDTTPPVLRVTPDPDAAHDGQLGFSVSTDPGNVVGWRLLGSGNREVASGTFVAGANDDTVEQDVPEGQFDLVVGATDRYDRTTSDVSSAAIGPNRIPTALILFFIVGAVGLLTALAVGIAHVLRPRRARIAASLARTRVTIARLLSPALDEDEDEEVVDRPVPVYRAVGDATARRDMLRTFLDVAAAGERELPQLPDFFLVPEERVLYTVDADLYEGLSDDEDLPEPTNGQLIVTTERVAFRNDIDRDWWWALLERMEHQGATGTVVRSWHSDSWVGLAYDSPEETRLYLELGRALQHGRPEPVIADATARLEETEGHIPPQRPAKDESSESPLDVGIWA